MSGRYPIADDSILTKWMRLEMGKLNDGIVSERKSLSKLLTEERPVSRTKAGKEHVFDISELKELSERFPPDLHDKLKLPVIFFSDTRVPDSCYLNDPNALSALQILGELSEMRQMQQGRMWVGKSIAYSIMKKYPTLVQIALR